MCRHYVVVLQTREGICRYWMQTVREKDAHTLVIANTRRREYAVIWCVGGANRHRDGIYSKCKCKHRECFLRAFVAYKQKELRRHCGAGKYAVDLEYKCNEKGCAGIVVQQTAERDQQSISIANKRTQGAN